MARRLLGVLAIATLLAASCSGGGSEVGEEGGPLDGDGSTTTANTIVDPTPVELDLDKNPLIVFGAVPPKPADRADWPTPDGSGDFYELFRSDDGWEDALARIDAIKIHAWMVRHYFTDDDLRLIFEALERYEVALVLESEPLQPPDPDECNHTESFEGPYDLEMVQRIKDLGGHLAAVAIEQPYSYAVTLDTDGACQYTLERTIDEVLDYVAELRTIFPGVPVGSIEAIWSSPRTTADDMVRWLDTYEAMAGEPFAFLHMDPNWQRDDWPEVAREIEAVADERNVPFGILFNGGQSLDNDEWLQTTAEHLAEFAVEHGGTVDHVVFQSWVEQPDTVLPDDSTSGFTHLVNRYFGTRPVFEPVTFDPAVGVVGRVVDQEGAPIADAEVTLSARPLDGAAQQLTVGGTIPTGIERALIAVRVNVEDTNPGDADVRLYDIAFDDAAAAAVPNGDFAGGLDRWGVYGDPLGAATVVASDTGAGSMLRLRATPDQEIWIDGDEFAVTPGADFTFSATVGVPESSIGTANVAVIFLSGTEGSRVTIPFVPEVQPVATAVSDADGRFTVPVDLPPGTYEIRTSMPGDIDTWPGGATTRVDVG